jgi:hypothetical protein
MVKLIRSVVEGIGSLGEGIGHLVKGEFDEFGEDMARFGLEAAGVVGQIFAGPMAEELQEMIEGAVDGRLSGPGSGDVPPPGASAPEDSDLQIDTLWGESGPVGGGVGALVGALGSLGGPGAGDGLAALLDASDIVETSTRQTAGQLANIGAAFAEVESMKRASHGVYTRQMSSI